MATVLRNQLKFESEALKTDMRKQGINVEIQNTECRNPKQINKIGKIN